MKTAKQAYDDFEQLIQREDFMLNPVTLRDRLKQFEPLTQRERMIVEETSNAFFYAVRRATEQSTNVHSDDGNPKAT